jgi:hypothetical protein
MKLIQSFLCKVKHLGQRITKIGAHVSIKN